MTIRVIDPAMNDLGLTRIRETFDNMALTMGVTGVLGEERLYLDLPEGLVEKEQAGAKEGDRFYGVSEEGLEGVAVLHSMGWAIFYRNGSWVLPDGVDEIDPLDIYPLDEQYDYWYVLLGEYFQVPDMPDKIQVPLDDEINVEEGFGDADIDGEPLDPTEDEI